MKQKTTKLALMLLVAVVAFTSCSKSSKTARFLPDDAITMHIDVKQILDRVKLPTTMPLNSSWQRIWRLWVRMQKLKQY